AGIGLFTNGEALRIAVRWQHDGRDGQPIGTGKFEVALIVCRAAEDGAGAVFHENEIGDVDGKLGTGDDRMFHAQGGVVSLLLLRLDLGRARAMVLAFGDEGSGLRVAYRDRFGQRMIWREP